MAGDAKRLRRVAGIRENLLLSYRYSSSGQRYWTDDCGGEAGATASCEATYYALDGARAVGVFSESGELRYWNASGVGRHLADGSRRYYLTDHLGSVRTVVDGTGALVEARDYYPYGLELPERTVQASPRAKEGFTGHEKDRATGLVYAGARYYMPAVPRWTSTDPLAGKNIEDSPYSYVVGNPIGYVDFTGMDTTATTDSGAEVTITGEGSGLPSTPTGIVITARRTTQQDGSDGATGTAPAEGAVEPFSFTQAAYLPVEGIGVHGSYNVKGSVVIESLTDDFATLRVTASAFSSASQMGYVQWNGMLSIDGGVLYAPSGNAQGYGPSFNAPLRTPSLPSLSSADRDFIGAATFSIPRRSTAQVQLRVGYRFLGPEGFASPIPATHIHSLPIPERAFIKPSNIQRNLSERSGN